MKKTKYSFMAVAAIILVSGCSKDNLTAENTVTGNTTFCATLSGNLTKTAVDGSDKTKINWCANDALSIWGGENNKFTLSSGEGTTSGSFSGTVSTGTGQYAMYPYNASATIDASGIITTKVPNTQTVSAGSFDPAAAIMVGTISGEAISFYHAMAYLRITAPSNVTDLIEITIESNNGIQLTGDAKFTASTGAFTATGTPCKFVTVKPSGGSFTAGAIYYAAVIPGTYTGGLTVRYIYKDDTNHKLVGKSKSNTTALTLAAGKTKLLGAADLSSCTNYDVALQLWTDGPYWATTNIGAVAETDCGHFFAWGYTEGYVRNSTNDGWVLASDGTTTRIFREEDIPYRNTATYQDAAVANWSADWSVPTSDLLKTLVNYDSTGECTIEFVTTAPTGLKITGAGTGYTSNSIFLPVTGCAWNNTLIWGDYGYYSSCVQISEGYSSVLNFGYEQEEGIETGTSTEEKHKGFPIRPIRTSL